MWSCRFGRSAFSLCMRFTGRSVAPLLHEQLERGELRPIFLYDKVRTRKIHEDEIRRLDPEGLSFLNMNSPEDYEAALQLWRQETAIETETAPPHSVLSVELFGVARLLAKTQLVSLDRCRKERLSRRSFQPSRKNCRFSSAASSTPKV